jgi:hypothetical protein
MHLILTGATGLIGAGVLQHMLAAPEITRVSILSRRAVAMAEGHDKAKVIIHKDFNVYDSALLEEIKDANGCVWALGISQNDVDKQTFYNITHDMPLAAAKAFSSLHPDSPFTFVHVSGEGATDTPGMFTPLFGKVKGEAEASLLEFHKTRPNFCPIVVRPAAVDWRAHPEIHPFIPQKPWYQKVVIPVIEVGWKSMHTPTRELGKILTELAMSAGQPVQGPDVLASGRIVPNVAIRRMAGL